MKIHSIFSPFAFTRKRYGLKQLFVAELVGLLLLAAGGFLIVHNFVDSSWSRTSGTVIGFSDKATSAVPVNSPIVSYDVGGTTFNIVAPSPISLSTLKSGQPVQVAYDPNSAGEAAIVDTGVSRTASWIAALTGAAIIVGAITAFRRARDDSADVVPSSDLAPDQTHQV